MSYDSYRQMLSISTLHSDPVSYYKNSLQERLDDGSFELASNYKSITVLDRCNFLTSTVGVRLVKVSTPNRDTALRDDYFKVLFKDFNTTIDLGDLFEFDNYRWLVTDISSKGTPTLSCMIRRCNAKLKFVRTNNDVLPSPTNTIISLDCVVDKKIYSVKEDRYYAIPNDELRVKVPNCGDSRKIRFQNNKGTRFLIGNPVMAYATFGIDSISEVRTNLTESNEDNGILNLKLKMEAINNRMDNTSLMLAKQYCYADVVPEYLTFVPSGSDSLITSDGDMFKVEEVI